MIVQYFIDDCCVDVNTTKNNDGVTALHLAGENGHLDVVKYFMEDCRVFDVFKYFIKDCRVNVNTTKDNHGSTALHYASQEGQLDVVKYLIQDCCIDINTTTNNNGWTALHLAGGKGHLDVVKYFIQDCHVDANSKNSNGSTALHLASQYGHLDVVKYFIKDCRVNVNTTRSNDGWTALHSASLNGRLDVVTYFIQDCRINVNTTKNNNGVTALHLASEYGHLDVVKYLIETCNADLHVTTTSGKTVIQFARDSGKMDVVEYLTNVQSTPASQNAENDASDDQEIISDRQSLKALIDNPDLGPVMLSLPYLKMCTNNFKSKVIGHGAYGTVCYGCDNALVTHFAVKCVSLQVLDQQALDDVTQSFQREISVLKRFRHPNIVTMYGYNVSLQQKDQFLVYEHLSYGSLADLLNDENGRTRLASDKRLSIMFQLARAVHFLHTGGIEALNPQTGRIENLKVFHRDIKSGNICLTQDYTPKLIDCGLAKFVQDRGARATQQGLTPAATILGTLGPNRVFGTPGYICPVYSQSHGSYTYIAACDVFSLGVVFVELLVGSLQGGQSSQTGQTFGDFFRRYVKDFEEEIVEDGWNILKNDADPMAGWKDKILDRLCQITIQCMAPAPKRRISTLELTRALSKAMLDDFAESCDVTTDSNEIQRIGSASDISYHCILCHESTSRYVTCVNDHHICSECIEPEVQKHIMKHSADHFCCPKCASSFDDDALIGKIATFTYNQYIEKRSLAGQLAAMARANDVNHNEVMDSINNISFDIQRVLGGLAYLATNHVTECPTVVWIEPADTYTGDRRFASFKNWIKNATHKKYILYFVCEQSLERVSTIVPIDVTREWLRTVAPVLALGMVFLKAALMSTTGIPFPTFPIPGLSHKEQIKLTEDFVNDLLDEETTKLIDAFKNACSQDSALPSIEGSELLVLKTGKSFEFIKEKVMRDKRSQWRFEMTPVPNEQGKMIWVKNEYKRMFVKV